MPVGIFDVRDTLTRTTSASSQFCERRRRQSDGELDGVHPGEIGGVEHVATARPWLPRRSAPTKRHRIEDGHGVQAARTAFRPGRGGSRD
jgi:hypothetical protein